MVGRLHRKAEATNHKKRTRRNQRRRRRSEKRACCDTIGESSSVDDARRKRPRSNRKSQYSCLTHLQSDTSLHFHITTSQCARFVLQWVWYRERVHLTISRSFRLKPGVSKDLSQSSPVPAPLNEFSHGGYAGVRLGEARNPKPATHERDRTAGDSVPGSQDSITRGVQNLQLSEPPTTQTAPPAPRLETYSDAGATAATRRPSLCSMWFRSCSI